MRVEEFDELDVDISNAVDDSYLLVSQANALAAAAIAHRKTLQALSKRLNEMEHEGGNEETAP